MPVQDAQPRTVKLIGRIALLWYCMQIAYISICVNITERSVKDQGTEAK